MKLDAHSNRLLPAIATVAIAFSSAVIAGPATAPKPPAPAAESLLRAVKSGSSWNLVPVRFVAGAGAVLGSPALSGVQFLPIEFTGHAATESLDVGMPRVARISSALTALVLPDAEGTIVFHYRRGATQFGFAAFSPSAGVRVLLEQTGIDTGSATDPFDARVAVSQDGARLMLAAPHFSHGVGGLDRAWLVRLFGPPLAGGTDLVDLSPAGGIDVDPASMTFAAGALYAVANDGLVRAPADGSAPFTKVVVPPSGGASNPLVVGEFAVSADRSTLAFLAGVDELTVDLYVITNGSAPWNRTQSPARIDPPGFLPGTTDGPRLTLSEDGSFASYVTESALGGELWMIATAPNSGSPQQITSDANFEHSIDAMSGMHGGGARLSFLARGGATGADLYAADLLPGGALALTNLTATSGATAPTFPNAATLQVNATRALGDRRWIVDDRTASGQGFALLDIPASGAAKVAFTNLDVAPDLVAPGPRGSAWAALTSAASGDSLAWAVGNRAIATVLTAPPGVVLDSLVLDPSGTIGAFRAAFSNGAEFPIAVRFGTGALDAVTAGVAQSGVRDLGITRFGTVLWTASDGAGKVRTFAAPASGSGTVAIGASATDAFWIE